MKLKRRYRWLLYAGLTYLAWLLVTLPVEPFLAYARSQQIPLLTLNEQGTLWSGQAEAMEIKGLVLGGVEWRIAPLSLLRGRLGYHLQFRDQGGEGQAWLGVDLTGRASLEDFTGRLAAQRVLPLLPLPMAATLGGDLVFEDVDLELMQGRPTSASGYLKWQEAQLLSPVPLDMGLVELELQESDKGITGVYTGQGSAFVMEGTVQTDTAAGAYRSETLITPRSEEVADWLQGMGQARVGDAYRLAYEGQW